MSTLLLRDRVVGLDGSWSFALRPRPDPADVPPILNPPSLSVAPACCTRRTVGIGEDAQGKLRQPNRWGTDAWIQDYSRRSYVEGTFGTLRNPALGGLTRGLFCIIGLTKVTLALAAVVVALNARAIAEWAARNQLDTDDPRHEPPNSPTSFIEVDPVNGTPLGNGPPDGGSAD